MQRRLDASSTPAGAAAVAAVVPTTSVSSKTLSSTSGATTFKPPTHEPAAVVSYFTCASAPVSSFATTGYTITSVPTASLATAFAAAVAAVACSAMWQRHHRLDTAVHICRQPAGLLQCRELVLGWPWQHAAGQWQLAQVLRWHIKADRLSGTKPCMLRCQ